MPAAGTEVVPIKVNSFTLPQAVRPPEGAGSADPGLATVSRNLSTVLVHLNALPTIRSDVTLIRQNNVAMTIEIRALKEALAAQTAILHQVLARLDRNLAAVEKVAVGKNSVVDDAPGDALLLAAVDAADTEAAAESDAMDALMRARLEESLDLDVLDRASHQEETRNAEQEFRESITKPATTSDAESSGSSTIVVESPPSESPVTSDSNADEKSDSTKADASAKSEKSEKPKKPRKSTKVSKE